MSYPIYDAFREGPIIPLGRSPSVARLDNLTKFHFSPPTSKGRTIPMTAQNADFPVPVPAVDNLPTT